MLTALDIEAIVAQVRYKDWQFRVCERAGALYLQVHFIAPDADTSEPTLQHGRKWLLSPHMTRSDVVSTALKAVLAAEEHEAREQFLYRGVAVYGPHIDVEQLFAVATQEDRRFPA